MQASSCNYYDTYYLFIITYIRQISAEWFICFVASFIFRELYWKMRKKICRIDLNVAYLATGVYTEKLILILICVTVRFLLTGWCGEVRDVIFSDNGSVTVVYRVTIRGSDGEV